MPLVSSPQPQPPAPWPLRRLGCGPGLVGRPGLRCFDAGGPGRAGHLSVSLAYLRDSLAWCAQAGLRWLRLDPRLAPGPPTEGLAQIEACAVEMAYVGGLARAADIRLTMHAPPGVMLGAADERVAAGAAARLTQLAALLDRLGAMGGVIVTHVGGEGAEGRARWAERVQALPPGVRARLAVEHDLGHTAAEVVAMAGTVGVAVVFDLLHHRLRSGGLTARAGLALCLAAWPAGQTPEVHLSSPRTEAHLRRRGGQMEARLPRPEEHADLIHPFDLVYLLELADGLPHFDVFLEARASDMAVARARDDLRRYAPEWAARIQ